MLGEVELEGHPGVGGVAAGGAGAAQGTLAVQAQEPGQGGGVGNRN